MRGARLMGPSHNEPPDLPGAGDGGKIKASTARTSASPRILHSQAARPIALQRECHLLSDKCIGLIHTGVRCDGSAARRIGFQLWDVVAFPVLRTGLQQTWSRWEPRD